MVSVYILSSMYIKIFRVGAFQAGSFSQSCYRFNTYIGMAVILNALGEDGARQFSILIGLIIPIINILAVSTLSWHSGEKVSLLQRVRLTAKALISNPLIIACLALVATGLSGVALGMSAVSSFIAGTLSVVGLMFLGGMAGSTAGGVKTFRVGILSKAAAADLRGSKCTR